MEVWKDIEGYEGLYQVSTLGNIRSFHNHRGVKVRILRPKRCPGGYLQVALAKDKVISYKLIHRLVAHAFIDNPFGYEQVNHKDEDKTNNRADNLEWCTAKYNSNYGTGSKRMSESKKGYRQSMAEIEARRSRMVEWHKNNQHPMQKKVMCIETGEVFDSLKSAEDFIHAKGVWNVIHGKRKTCGGYHWRYA